MGEGGSIGGVETGFGGGWGLEDEVDGMGGGVLLRGKELDVDFAGVVEVLCDCEISDQRTVTRTSEREKGESRV